MKKGNRYSTHVYFRGKEEYDELLQRANDVGLSLSSYIRLKIFDKKIK